MFVLRATTCRCIHTSMRVYIDKSSLSKLRKKTGFSFINCKKALEQFDNDLEQAEKWLREQAQKEGWAKATKLQGRPMSQGLISILRDSNMATMIEMNCETDFVARNSKFHELVASLSSACHQSFVQTGQSKIELDKQAVTSISVSDGKTLADVVAMEVGNIGENMSLRRAVCLKGDNKARLETYVHVSGPEVKTDSSCVMGKYGALLTFQKINSESPRDLSLEETGQLICQHIVGMNPKVIGEPDEELQSRDEPKIVNADAESSQVTDGKVDEKEAKMQRIREEEKRLIFQDYLLDPDMTLGEFCQQNSVEVLDFVRFECGEELENETNEV